MSPKARRTSMSPRSLALPPMSRDFALIPTMDKALYDIRQVGEHLTLNRRQFKRLQAACESVYQLSTSREAQSVLIDVYSRCQIWRSADLLQSLVLIPDEMSRFEKQLNQLVAPRTILSNQDDEEEAEDIAEAVQKILSNEQNRALAMTLKDHPAELFVSHVQTALDKYPMMNSCLREECVKALRKLAVEAGVLPSSLKIEEVTLTNPHPVAQGGHSDVYQGRWKDKLVAVKRPRSVYSGIKLEELKKQTRREILVWRQLDDKYVVRLLGIFWEDLPSGLDSMVSEWMPNGTLHDFLEIPGNRDTNRLRLIYQISSALEYLHTHSPPIAHGDIKAGNIFIDANTRPVFGDFGLSCIHYTNRTMSSTLEGGTARWMAPELLYNDKGNYDAKPSLKSDIWAFAMLMLEVFTGQPPYFKDPEQIVVMLIARDRKLPERPGSHTIERGLTDAVWKLMNECWNFQHPEKRPEAKVLTGHLRKFSEDTEITEWKERTETVFIPKALVQDIILSDVASWKTLDVRIVEERGTIIRNDIPMAVIRVTGCAEPVAEACLRIEDSIKKSEDICVTRQIKIPKEYHSRIIGQGHCHQRNLEKKHGVRIKFPSRTLRSSNVTITGSAEAIEKAKEDLRKSLWFERNSRDVLKVSSRVAERVSEQRENILRPPLWDLNVEVHGDDGTITLRGKRQGIVIAQKSIRAIEEEIEQEITEEIPLDNFLHDMIKSDPRAWVDIVERCGGPPSPDPKGYPFVQSISLNGLAVRAPPKLMKALREEVGELNRIGDACVLAKRISANRHQSLLGMEGGLISDLRKHANAMVYFPASGGYSSIRKPVDMDRYVHFEEIVKVVGRVDECKKAREYLETRVETQRKEESKRKKNPLYCFPAILYNAVKRKLDPMLNTFGVKEESKVPISTDSILCFVSQDKDLITASGPGWSIHERAEPDLPMCQMQLMSDKDEDSIQAGELLKKEASSIYRRIGVMKLPTLPHALLIRENLGILESQGNDLLCELVEMPSPGCLVIGGPSTKGVESVINSAIALMEAGGD